MQGCDNEAGQKQSLRLAGLINAGKRRKCREIQLDARKVHREGVRRWKRDEAAGLRWGKSWGSLENVRRGFGGGTLDTEDVGVDGREVAVCYEHKFLLRRFCETSYRIYVAFQKKKTQCRDCLEYTAGSHAIPCLGRTQVAGFYMG